MIGNSNLNDFLKGKIADIYTDKTSQGFPLMGNTGCIHNTPTPILKNIHDGILVNTANYTQLNNSNAETFNTSYTTKQGTTPILYYDEEQISELLPYYPTGEPNKNLSPSCNLQLGSMAFPAMYGATTFGVNDPKVLNDSCNKIGHELQNMGIANKYGTRALGQGSYAQQKLVAGFNEPQLTVTQNENKMYYSTPESCHKDIPLYQTGDWTTAPGTNWLKEFTNGIECQHKPA